jgi:mRNA interferase MazF
MRIERELRRGDLVVAAFGRDLAKPRPGVVVQSDPFVTYHSSVVLCPVSSTLTAGLLYRVRLRHEETEGLKQDSEVMVDKLGAVEKIRIRQRIGRLTPDQMAAVDQVLRIWLDLPGIS